MLTFMSEERETEEDRDKEKQQENGLMKIGALSILYYL